MKTFADTQKRATKELIWLINSAKITNKYEDCVEKKYIGKLPYSMIMKVLKNNDWGNVTENGKGGYNHLWIAQSMNCGLTFQHKTGLVVFTFYESIN